MAQDGRHIAGLHCVFCIVRRQEVRDRIVSSVFDKAHRQRVCRFCGNAVPVKTW